MKLSYRRISERDAEELLDLWGDSEVIKYTNIKALCDLAAIKSRIIRLVGQDIFLINMDGVIIGVVGCPCIDAQRNEYGLFYQIKKNYWGRGIATQVAAWMIDYMKTKASTLTLYADVVANNLASEKILIHFGFTCISEQSGGFEFNGMKMDIYNYRLETGDERSDK